MGFTDHLTPRERIREYVRIAWPGVERRFGLRPLEPGMTSLPKEKVPNASKKQAQGGRA